MLKRCSCKVRYRRKGKRFGLAFSQGIDGDMREERIIAKTISLHLQ